MKHDMLYLTHINMCLKKTIHVHLATQGTNAYFPIVFDIQGIQKYTKYAIIAQNHLMASM